MRYRRLVVVVAVIGIASLGLVAFERVGRRTVSIASVDLSTVPKLTCGAAHATLPKDFTVFFDAVALPTTDHYPSALQTSSGGDDPATRLFAKTGIWYRADTSFDILVPGSLKQDLAVGWGGAPSSPGPGVVSGRCPGADHGWVVHPGGYWVSRTMCATLVVRASGEEKLAKIGLGAPCPGQSQPDGPSDK